MIIFALMLAQATVLTPNEPKMGLPVGKMYEWVNNYDWSPTRANGAVRYKILFNLDGIPETCAILATNGNKEVEALICPLVGDRFRFKPSFDSDGNPVKRILFQALSMKKTISDELRVPPLYSVTAKGYTRTSRLLLVADVKADGSLAGCSNTEKKKSLIKLAQAVCQTIRGIWEPLPEIDSSGKAIRYVRTVLIEVKPAR